MGSPWLPGARYERTGKATGNRLLKDSLADLVSCRVVTSEKALSKAVDKAELAKRLGQRVE